MLAVGGDIDPHPTWPGRDIATVHLRIRIDDVQIKPDGLDGLQRRLSSDRFPIARDQLVNGEWVPGGNQLG